MNQTGVPQPFKVEYYSLVENENLLERLIHQHFENARPNKNREFFNIDPAIAINIIRELALEHSPIKYEEVFYITPEQLEAINAAEKKKIEDEQKEIIKQREEAIALKLEAAKTEKAAIKNNKKRRVKNGIVWYLIVLIFYTFIFIGTGEDLTIINLLLVIMISYITWFILLSIWLRIGRK